MNSFVIRVATVLLLLLLSASLVSSGSIRKPMKLIKPTNPFGRSMINMVNKIVIPGLIASSAMVLQPHPALSDAATTSAAVVSGSVMSSGDGNMSNMLTIPASSLDRFGNIVILIGVTSLIIGRYDSAKFERKMEKTDERMEKNRMEDKQEKKENNEKMERLRMEDKQEQKEINENMDRKFTLTTAIAFFALFVPFIMKYTEDG